MTSAACFNRSIILAAAIALALPAAAARMMDRLKHAADVMG